MAMGQVTGDCTPFQVDDDIWVQASIHGPGNAGPMKVVNRTIIYRLHGDDGPFLVALNGLWVNSPEGGPIAALLALAKDLGAPLRFLLTPDSSHHLSLHHYAAGLPDTRVCVPAGRIERENPTLLGLPNVETYTDEPPEELERGGLKILLWRGIMEGPFVAKFMRMQFRFGYELGSVETQVFLHTPTGTITNGGHHMWFRPDEEAIFQGPALLFRLMSWMGFDLSYHQPGKLSLDPNGGTRILDKEAVRACAAEVLSWDFDKMLDVHAGVGRGHMTTGAKEIWEDAIGPIARGDWDQVPWMTS